MRVTRSFTKTRKEAPADETAKNAQLLIRAGFIKKEMAGVYAYLPLGLRVLEKIKKIVREEMNRTGSEELTMTTLQPKEIWEKTDRWDDAKVDNWFKTKLTNGTQLGVGLTHEEPIVDAARAFISSYKDLPKSVYQIGLKFRNEKRARSGILRGREFIMKDAYTFSRNQQEHEAMYETIAKAYARVYDRLGIGDITFRVKADGGIFTKRFSDEFQTLSPVGEDTLFHVPETDLYYNGEVAPAATQPQTDNQTEKLPMKEVETVGVVGVGALAEVLNVHVTQTVKTMLYTADGSVIAVAVRGDHNINELKLRKVLEVSSLQLADEKTVKDVTSAEVGYAGLIGLPDTVRIVVDDSCRDLINFELGANKTNFHNVNVNWSRDIDLPKTFYDVKEAQPGDIHPDTGVIYETLKAVEVGNIFPLETKYTDALGVYYIDEEGKSQSIIMGCYGIGVTRVMGIIAEHFADSKGLVWPGDIAPYRVYLASFGTSESVVAAADELYSTLLQQGVEVLYDDRDERPGTKMNDSELLGIPIRVIISEKTLESGNLEVKYRTEAETLFLTQEEFLNRLRKQ